MATGQDILAGGLFEDGSLFEGDYIVCLLSIFINQISKKLSIFLLLFSHITLFSVIRLGSHIFNFHTLYAFFKLIFFYF